MTSIVTSLLESNQKIFSTKKSILSHWNQDSLVGIATCYGLDDKGVGLRVPIGSRIFCTSSRLALGPTQPPIQWVLGALYSGV
jgi:hypothetical protein